MHNNQKEPCAALISVLPHAVNMVCRMSFFPTLAPLTPLQSHLDPTHPWQACWATRKDVCCVKMFVIYLTCILSVIQKISSEHPFCQICHLRDKNDPKMTSSVHSYGSKNLTYVFQLQRPHSTEVNAKFRCSNILRKCGNYTCETRFKNVRMLLK